MSKGNGSLNEVDPLKVIKDVGDYLVSSGRRREDLVKEIVNGLGRGDKAKDNRPSA